MIVSVYNVHNMMIFINIEWGAIKCNITALLLLLLFLLIIHPTIIFKVPLLYGISCDNDLKV